jgi:hypothetical protein
MDPDPAPDPTTFFIDFKDAKKKLNFLSKFCVKILICRHYFSPLNKNPEPDPDPDPYLRLMDPDPDPRGPKTSGQHRLKYL